MPLAKLHQRLEAQRFKKQNFLSATRKQSTELTVRVDICSNMAKEHTSSL